MFLSQFAYRIEHVDGEVNVLEDIMTRWLRGYRGNQQAIKRVAHRLLQHDLVPSPSSDKFDWPSLRDVRKSQKNHVKERPSDAKHRGDDVWLVGERIWVPDADDELQLRLLVVAHCGTAGHRGVESTADIVRETYAWQTVDADAAAFVADCVHCLMAKTGQKVRRPYAPTLHATHPNQVLHFDYLYMGQGQDGKLYTLVLKDDLSGYVWLRAAAAADADNAAREIASWIRTFSAMDHWVSDRVSHFRRGNRSSGEIAPHSAHFHSGLLAVGERHCRDSEPPRARRLPCSGNRS